jgi:hypothetical protein
MWQIESTLMSKWGTRLLTSSLVGSASCCYFTLVAAPYFLDNNHPIHYLLVRFDRIVTAQI